MKKNKPKKILIIKLGAMGDVIHTTIIATAIKQKHPDWQVDFMTAKSYADIIKNHPHIDNIILWERINRKSVKYLSEITYKLFSSRYDIIFNLTRAMRNNLMALLALPKKYKGKMNFNTSWVEEYFLTAKSVIKDLDKPERLYLSKNNHISEKIQNIIKNKPKPIFIFSPGGDTDKNRQGRIWNLENWKSLAKKINKEFSGSIIVCGSPREKETHLNLKSDIIEVLSGELNTAEMSELISQSDMMISGDTGPAHVASAHNIKTLILLGSTSPDKIKPYGTNGHFISSNNNCLYCWEKKCKYLKKWETYTPCMEAIKVEDVFEKIKEIYNNSS